MNKKTYRLTRHEYSLIKKMLPKTIMFDGAMFFLDCFKVDDWLYSLSYVNVSLEDNKKMAVTATDIDLENAINNIFKYIHTNHNILIMD